MQIDLDSLREILKELSSSTEGKQELQHVLTENDIFIIAHVMQAVVHTTCSVGFTPEEVRRIKSVIGMLNITILGLGYGILAAIGAGMAAFVAWAIRHGILDITHSR